MPTPRKGETRESFMSRCVPMRHSEHPNEPNNQSVAVCFSMWKEHSKKSAEEKAAELTTDTDFLNRFLEKYPEYKEFFEDKND